MGSIAVTTLSAPNPPPLALARPHPSSPRLGSYCELAASPHLAVGLRPCRLAASHNHNQGKRGLELAGIDGRLARRGARLASGGCLVGAVLLFSRRCARVFCCFVRRPCRPFVRCRWSPRVRGRRVAWRRSSPVASFLRVCLRPRLVFRPSLVVVRGWLVLVGRAGLAVRAGVVFGWGLALLAVCGRGCFRRAAPFFRRITTDRCGGTLPACGQQQLDRCGGTNREEYLSAKGDLAKRGYANDQGLNQTSGIR